MVRHVLTINGGSSSLKFGLYTVSRPVRRALGGQIERIGLADPRFKSQAADRERPEFMSMLASDHATAVAQLIGWLDRRIGLASVSAVGHRVVHGGPHYSQPSRITTELLAELRRLSDLDPAHLPAEIALIEAFAAHCPGLPQVACFDTAFHHEMPRIAKILPIPRRYEAAGVRRYGFHGISYTFLLGELTRVAGAEAAQGRLIFAHLGSGASMAAVRHGKCVETTMGFTPTSGLVMGTRSGDLDPGLLIYFLRNENMTADQIDSLVNSHSGLLGVSEVSSDMRDLLARQASDVRAREAVDLFCYQARKWIGALAAVLGGLDILVFTGGVGENSAEIRARICEGLEFLMVRVDAERNAANAPLISRDGAVAEIRVIRTDEESMIAEMVLRAAELVPNGSSKS